MTFTYDPSLGTTLSQLRFRIGDTDENAPFFSDEELTFILTDRGNNIDQAAIWALDSLITKYSRKVDVTVGDVQVRYSGIVENFTALRNRLMARSTKTGIFVGGLTDSNGEEVKPFFTREFP